MHVTSVRLGHRLDFVTGLKEWRGTELKLRFRRTSVPLRELDRCRHPKQMREPQQPLMHLHAGSIPGGSIQVACWQHGVSRACGGISFTKSRPARIKCSTVKSSRCKTLTGRPGPARTQLHPVRPQGARSNPFRTARTVAGERNASEEGQPFQKRLAK